jgi:hypothetical protein
MLDTVYGQLCKSEHSMERFSKPVGTNIATTLLNITGWLYLVLGKSQCCTMLMIPRDALTAEPMPTILHTFESHVSQWVEHIRRFLPSEMFGPLAEINYWWKRQQNLEFLKKQIYGDDVRIVMEVLKECSPSFVGQFPVVDEALGLKAEATHGTIPFGGFLEQIENLGADMEELCEPFQPVFYFL